MKKAVKNTMKFALGVCAALSVVTFGAVIASGTAVKVVTEGFKAGAEAMKKTIDDLRAETAGEAEFCAEENAAEETAVREVTAEDLADESGEGEN